MKVLENKIFILGITGGTASGKTTIVSELSACLPSSELCVISQDSYYKKTDDLTYKEKINLNFDHPEAIDFDLLIAQLQDLKNNKSIEQPVYSFTEHNRTTEKQIVAPKKIIIVEGILIFNDKRLLDLFDLKIFIHADADERLIRRIHRDGKERGRNVNEVTKRYRVTLKPMHNLFIEPFKKSADFVFDNTNSKKNISEELAHIIQDRLEKTNETN